MFVTAQEYRDYQTHEGARIYAWMLKENGLNAEQILASVTAMEAHR